MAPQLDSSAVAADSEPTGDLTCPLLGLARHPQARLTYPSPTHLCYAGRPASIGLSHQADFCLGGAFERCPRFERAVGYTADGTPLGARGNGRSLGAAAAGLAVLAVLTAIAVFSVASGLLTVPADRDPAAIPPASPTPAESPGEVATPSLEAIASPSAASPSATLPVGASPDGRPGPSPTPAVTSTARPAQQVHVVQAGESLAFIAAQYGVPWPSIAAANGITNPDRLLVGQRLVIPAPATVTDETVHYIRPGETLNAIATQYGVSVSDLAVANGLEDWNFIYVGQRLIIPRATP